MAGDCQLVWLASLPERSMQSGRRYRWSDIFSNSVLAAEFTECRAENGPMEYPSNVLWGIAGVRVDRRHSPLDVLTKYEACQVRGWQMLVETTGSYDLAQELVFFRVETVWLLDQPVKVPTYNGARNNCSLLQLDGDFRVRLSHRLQNPPCGMPAPRLVMRMPAPWCPMVLSQRWATFCLPDPLNGTRWRSLAFEWAQTLLTRPALRKILHEETPNLSQESWQDCADAFRRLHAVQASSDVGDGDLCETERHIGICQQMSDDLDVDSIKTLWLTSGFNSTGKQRQNRRFKQMFLLKTMMMCASLRTTTALSHIMKEMASICLPKNLRHMVDPLLEVAASHMPSTSTISRVRTVLDGAFMLYERKLNARWATGSGATRFLMADSSMQHGTEFEGVLCLTIPNDDLPKACTLVNELTSIRSSSVFLKLC